MKKVAIMRFRIELDENVNIAYMKFKENGLLKPLIENLFKSFNADTPQESYQKMLDLFYKCVYSNSESQANIIERRIKKDLDSMNF
jgi:hypothetical protein